MKSAVIYGFEVKPALNSVVYIDGRNIGERLMPGDEPIESWPGCEFRLSSWHQKAGIPVNIEITGRTLQRKNDCLCARIKLEIVNDGEPNSSMSGWLVVC